MDKLLTASRATPEETCLHCDHWTQRAADTAAGAPGWCDLFVKRTSADHGRQCTAWTPRQSERQTAPAQPAPVTAGYPADWKAIATRIKDLAGWVCERCKEPHRVEGAFVLTVHHLDGNKANCEDWNLAALCQRCHLRIQGRVKMDQLFFMDILDVSSWFRPHLDGYLKSKSRKPHVD